ncbi:twin-arginine translocase subunit TatB [Sphingobium indicum]|uniref:Translocase n=3 Tax=Sphingobium indicum TaxID=332055 RepID=A0A8E1C0X3_9SPHN|nr:Sec-independent protein translocase protein TatB [Sphingobium indicum]EPR08738.1 translocase [Sphingobium indicum IP26]KEY98930.1 translocase [Sphingomonas sp. BHC-A]APL93185.1 translocase [Sphingobium indicum B90A]KER34403.1 translocase [Sphingobium indicum F2]NYI22177.1 sec-independent protein translocase protein TatB [Sphingobium indicum]
MFGIDSSELLVIVIIAVIVIGPKDLPRALYKIGQIVGKAQGMARHFRTGIDAMVREVELEELEKKWAAQNKRIMEEHPPETAAAESVGEAVALPAPAAGSAAGEAPFLAEPEPAGEEPPPIARPAAEGPPYVAQEPARKGGAAA